MTTTCIIQARTGSSRLPGKVLQDVAGRPMLRLMLERLERLQVDNLVVATSVAERDDAIVNLCATCDIPVTRGSEQDVLARLAETARTYPASTIVRLTADCPLSDPRLIGEVLATHHKAGTDYTSNTLLRTYPNGLDVEVMTHAALKRAAAKAQVALEREHVTPWIYRHPEINSLASHLGVVDAGDESWTVDTAADLENVRAIAMAVDDPVTAPWTEMLHAHGRRADRPIGSLRLRPATADDAERLLEWRNDQDAVRFSRSGQPVAQEVHERWIGSHLDRPRSRIWIGMVGGEPVGEVRIDVAAAVGEVGVAVDRRHRGLGYGGAIIKELLRTVRQDYQVTALVAVVHADNEPSLRAFQSSGFRVSRLGQFATLRWDR